MIRSISTLLFLIWYPNVFLSECVPIFFTPTSAAASFIIFQNLRFRRLHLRGLAKVTVELGWVGLALNLKKMAGKSCHHSPTNTFHQEKGSRDHVRSRLPLLHFKGFWDSPFFEHFLFWFQKS